jgi:hypothetical protein
LFLLFFSFVLCFRPSRVSRFCLLVLSAFRALIPLPLSLTLSGYTPLHCAAQHGSHLALLAVLNNKYFDSLNKVDGRGSTALHLASNNG